MIISNSLTYDESIDINFVTSFEVFKRLFTNDILSMLTINTNESLLKSCIPIAWWQIRGEIEHRAPYLGVRFARSLFVITNSAGIGI